MVNKRPYYIGLLAYIVLSATILCAGPYSGSLQNDFELLEVPDPAIAGLPVTGPDPNSDPNDSFSIITKWATQCTDYSPSDSPIDSGWTISNKTLGPATGDHFDICSLGDLLPNQISSGSLPGSITLTFDQPITNKPGPDFAVFENSFISAGPQGQSNYINAELAYIEVSTDGITFVRFPSVSLNDPNTAIGAYDSIDPTNIYNLAGKHVNSNGTSWGTPFDLNDLKNIPEIINEQVNLNEINYVRVVDIPGTGDYYDNASLLPDLTATDSESGIFENYPQNNAIRDPWFTWGSGGFDLEAIGIISLTNADGNMDGTVDLADMELLIANWLDNTFWYYGDYNQDGIVNNKDLAILSNNWLK